MDKEILNRVVSDRTVFISTSTHAVDLHKFRFADPSSVKSNSIEQKSISRLYRSLERVLELRRRIF
jgi:hypothetical protein